MAASSSKALPLVLNREPRKRAAVIQALRIGRRCGLRAGYDAINQLAEELALTRDELQRLRDRYAMAREIIRRADAIDALRERADSDVTLH